MIFEIFKKKRSETTPCGHDLKGEEPETAGNNVF